MLSLFSEDMLSTGVGRFVGLKDFGARIKSFNKGKPEARRDVPEVDSDQEDEEVVEKSFWHTTGMYPQSMLLSFERMRLCQLELVCSDNTRAIGLYDDGWKELANLEPGRHRLKFKRQKTSCRALRLTIDATTTPFSFVKSIRLVGYTHLSS